MSTRWNLIPNPSFEVDTSSAWAVQSTLLRDNTWAVVGTYSCKITPSGTNSSHFTFGGDVTNNMLQAKAGQTVTISGTIRLTAAQTGTRHTHARSIAVYGYAAGWSLLSASAQAPNSAGATRLSVTVTIPSNVTGLDIRFYNGASSGNGVVWWDALLMEDGSVLREYFDGDRLDTQYYTYRWQGTTGVSASYEDQVRDTDVNGALKAPQRTWQFRHQLLDGSMVFKADLEVSSAKIEYNALADKVKRTANYVFSPESSALIDFYTDHVRSWADIKMPDGTWHEWCVGTFLVSGSADRWITKARRINGEEIIVPQQQGNTAVGYDRLLILAEDMSTDRVSVDVGAKYTTSITTIMANYGGIDLPDHDATTPAVIEWPGGTSKLQIVNDLLAAINYTSLSADAMGQFFSNPYKSIDQYTPEWSYTVDRDSVIIPGVDILFDLFNVPNVFVGFISDPDRPVLRSVYTNDNPASPTSTVSRGRNIVAVIEPPQIDRSEELDQAATQALLDEKVQRAAEEMTTQYMHADFSTGLMPFHGDGTVAIIDYGEGANPFKEVSWSMDLVAGGQMTHSFRRPVAV